MTRVRVLRSMALVCLMVLAASCGSGDDTSAGSSANYASFDTDEQANAEAQGDTDASAAGGNTDAAPKESAGADPDAAPADALDGIVETFDTFLALRAQAITGTIAVDELGVVATPQAIEQVAQLRSTNDDLIARDSYAALSDLAEWSNVTQVAQSEDRYIFTDCTERQFITPGGATVVHFVTNNVTMIDGNDGLRVEDVIEIQDGSFALEPDEFGCVPPSFIERAERAATNAVNEAARLIEDPSAAVRSDLPAIFSGTARSELERVLQSLNVQGLSRAADEAVDVSVIGMDVNRPEFTVVVSVCRTYPHGRVFVDRAGEELTTDIAIGSSHEEWLYVQLEPVPPGAEFTDTTTVVEDRGPNCQGG